jgi:hypothetical protein
MGLCLDRLAHELGLAVRDGSDPGFGNLAGLREWQHEGMSLLGGLGVLGG